MSDRQDTGPGTSEQALAFRLLSSVAAASYANALDGQLTQMLREAFADSGERVDVTDNRSLGEAIENLAIVFRDYAWPRDA
jgi:hypothetical protein